VSNLDLTRASEWLIRAKSRFGTPVLRTMLTHHPHTPNHLFLDHTTYFITGAIYQKRPLLGTKELKELLLEKLFLFFTKYKWQLHHWVILDNHYHLIGQSNHGADLSKIIRGTHTTLAQEIWQQTRSERPIWWNYWDYCPRNEQEVLTRLNYLLYNPIKHKYVTNLQEYPYSSFQEYYAQMGRQHLLEQFRKYPEYKTLELKEALHDDF
jgi:putative transposase